MSLLCWLQGAWLQVNTVVWQGEAGSALAGSPAAAAARLLVTQVCWDALAPAVLLLLHWGAGLGCSNTAAVRAQACGILISILTDEARQLVLSCKMLMPVFAMHTSCAQNRTGNQLLATGRTPASAHASTAHTKAYTHVLNDCVGW
jgi:hypothetical protein